MSAFVEVDEFTVEVVIMNKLVGVLSDVVTVVAVEVEEVLLLMVLLVEKEL